MKLPENIKNIKDQWWDLKKQIYIQILETDASVDTAFLQTGNANTITITIWQQLINRLSKPVKLSSWFWKTADFSIDMMWLKCSWKA